MQLDSKTKRRRMQLVDELTAKIAAVDSQNKLNPSHSLQSQIFKLRHELPSVLLEGYELNLRKLKTKSYTTNNKAGKIMACCIKGQRLKSRITHLFYPSTQNKMINPQAIADTFSSYYSNLYNLKTDSQTHQPNQAEIQSFLNHVNLPSRMTYQLSSLNSPFTEPEIQSAIESLHNSKSPGPDGLTGVGNTLKYSILR